MATSTYVWMGLGVVLIVVIGLLDGLRRRRIADARARMTPEEQAIAKREDRVFSSSVRRGR